MARVTSHRAVSRRAQACAMLGVTVLALTGCDSDDESSAAATLAGTSPESSMTADFSNFCERLATLEGEQPEAYVGSAEHRADTESLIEVAPQAVMAPLQTFAAFLASGAIDAADPESNLVENWPPEVQAAIGEVAAFNDASC